MGSLLLEAELFCCLAVLLLKPKLAGGGISGPSEDETTENPNDQEDNENEDVDNGTDVGDDDNIYAQDAVNFSVQISAFLPFSSMESIHRVMWGQA